MMHRQQHDVLPGIDPQQCHAPQRPLRQLEGALLFHTGKLPDLLFGSASTGIGHEKNRVEAV